MSDTNGEYKEGSDLILGLYLNNAFVALGHSTDCKIANKATTASRKTKEVSDGKWEEKYVKTLGVTITSNGFVYKGDSLGLPELTDLWTSAAPVTARYAYRGEEATVYREGLFVITELDDEGKAGEDETYSVTLENSGAVVKKTVAAPSGGSTSGGSTSGGSTSGSNTSGSNTSGSSTSGGSTSGGSGSGSSSSDDGGGALKPKS
jgi:hypothetical protein